MSEFAASAANQVFQPRPGHNPRSRQERNKRAHFYVSHLGYAAANQLRHALVILRDAAEEMPTPQLQEAVRKPFSEDEFLAAVKELLCIWIHLNAVDQGAEAMPSWLIGYHKLAMYASDFLIEFPPASQILRQHAGSQELSALQSDVAIMVARYLGFGDTADSLGQALEPLLSQSRATRQKVFKESLTMELD